MRGEVPVALVSARHGHHRTRAIARQHIVTDPNRNGRPSEWMLGIRPSERARNRLHIGHAVAVAAGLGLGDVGLHLGLLFSGGYLRNQLVLWCQHHERYSENRIRSGRKHLHL
jgi:hypothetical protein